ncbi:MAG: hypothetical protein PHN56_05595 [Candidatus Nanoarchaeia archaeon]|nr:hypothetical protein [Candidatus Nanoarchaeia archaeon]
MSESQSRYSIVERLTAKKLAIMNDKSELKETVKSKEQEVERLKKELGNWQQDVQEDIKREQRRKEIHIESTLQDFNNLKEQMKDKEKAFDEQIIAIEKALKSIEEISKSSPTMQS